MENYGLGDYTQGQKWTLLRKHPLPLQEEELATWLGSILEFLWTNCYYVLFLLPIFKEDCLLLLSCQSQNCIPFVSMSLSVCWGGGGSSFMFIALWINVALPKKLLLHMGHIQITRYKILTLMSWMRLIGFWRSEYIFSFLLGAIRMHVRLEDELW